MAEVNTGPTDVEEGRSLWQKYGRRGLAVALLFFLLFELPLLLAMVSATGLFGLDAYPALRWGLVVVGVVVAAGCFAVRRWRRNRNRNQVEDEPC